MSSQTTLDERIRAVKQRVSIEAAVSAHVVLSGRSGSRNRRGKCPFHGSSSNSFSVQGDKGFAHCFGCQWHGDAIKFVQDFLGLSFADALAMLEAQAGLVDQSPSSTGAGMVQRKRNPQARPDTAAVSPLVMARWIWREAKSDLSRVRRYFEGRGVPVAALGDERLHAFRYLGKCPVMPWREGRNPQRSVPCAPAVIALVTRPVAGETGINWQATGLHVTYLDATGTSAFATPVPWASGETFPKRRMLGPVGGAGVVLGKYDPEARLWVGEGNETVLSAMALGSAGARDCGIATLSLGNLQGEPLYQHRKGFERIWPLHAIEPDPASTRMLIPGHRGPVTGLIDSDMKPLRGMKDRRTGAPLGENVIERKGGLLTRRAITGAERARICGELFVKAWKSAGVFRVDARRAPPGMDFNDVARGTV